jgi:hypothetical protein
VREDGFHAVSCIFLGQLYLVLSEVDEQLWGTIKRKCDQGLVVRPLQGKVGRVTYCRGGVRGPTDIRSILEKRRKIRGTPTVSQHLPPSTSKPTVSGASLSNQSNPGSHK